MFNYLKVLIEKEWLLRKKKEFCQQSASGVNTITLLEFPACWLTFFGLASLYSYASPFLKISLSSLSLSLYVSLSLFLFMYVLFFLRFLSLDILVYYSTYFHSYKKTILPFNKCIRCRILLNVLCREMLFITPLKSLCASALKPKIMYFLGTNEKIESMH